MTGGVEQITDEAYGALDKIAAQVNASTAELDAAIAGPAKKFYEAACLREEEASGDLPRDQFKDLARRWFLNWREIYRTVLRTRAAAGPPQSTDDWNDR